MTKSVRLIAVAGLAAALIVPATAAGAAGPKYTPLVLDNGATTTSQSAVPAFRLASNVVTFKGGLQQGSSTEVFTLPAKETPATDVYIALAPCEFSGSNRRLHIAPTGQAVVESKPLSFGCTISLDGASFTLTEKGSKPLPLTNGWTNAPFNTSNAAVRMVSGVVRLQGAVSGGTSPVIGTLPKQFWPKNHVVMTIDLCDSAHGLLDIGPQGTLTVFADVFTQAQCFTSLDGVTYVKASAKAATLENGWAGQIGGRPAGVHASGKVVHFEGVVADGTDALIMTLPAKDAPATDVIVPVTVCGTGAAGSYASLLIEPSGAVSIATPGDLSAASCTTDLDGAWFAQ